MQKLEWDSKFWNQSIYEINEDEITESLDINIEKKVYLIQSKLKINDTFKINKLERLGFSFQDLEIEYIKEIYNNNINIENINYKMQKLEEINLNEEDLENVINPLTENSRFNLFGEKNVEKFYRTWIENTVQATFDDECFVIRNNNLKIIGIITYKKLSNKIARLGLLSIDSKYQGKNIGGNLLKQLEKYLYDKGIEKLIICTQGKNKKANNFYIKNGYKINEIRVIMYLYKEEEKL
jgi:ribosomal protein S18 acetylase RimI-like enzyme